MQHNNSVSEHYKHGDLLNAIQTSIAKLGKTIENVTIDDLAPVDEFHIGGRLATENFLAQLNFSEQDHILDVGCGLGGAARYVAHKYKSHVTGIDLTEEYIETGTVLCTWVKLDKQINLQLASALSIPFPDKTFDGSYMMHVGMNIEEKERLFSEIYRVLRSGSFFGVYDIMRINDGELTYPVPWATENSLSRLATPDQYRQTLFQAGFEISQQNNRRDFALSFFKKLRAKAKTKGSPPPLGLHTLMKESAGIKIKNMIDNISAGYIAPIEIIAQKYK